MQKATPRPSFARPPFARRQAWRRLSAAVPPPVWSPPRGASAHASRAETAITTPDSTAHLLARSARGDLPAFRALYAAQSARLYGLALRVTRDAGLASDAVQETFLQVWRRAERFDAARGNPDTWLAALVRYRAIDILRRRGREHATGALPDRPSEEPDALDQLMTTAEGAALRTCLAALPDDRRALLLRAFVGGRSYAELAAEDGEPLGTVKARIRRALAALKQCLSP